MYESISALEKEFKARIAKAEEGEVQAIEREMADAKVEFLSAQIQARDLQDARRAAVQKYPFAADWAEELRGNTAEEIEAHAAKIHERMEKFQTQRAEDGGQPTPQQQQPDPNQPDPAVMAYGQPGVGGQGAPAPAPDRERELFHKLVGSGGGKNRNMTAAEASEYQRLRAARALDMALKNKGVPVGLGGNAGASRVRVG